MRFLHDASLGFFARRLPLAAASAKSAVWNKRHVEGIRDLTWANFPKADLRGANIQDSKDYSNSAIFKNGKYERSTRWPRGFDYESSGAVLVKEEAAR